MNSDSWFFIGKPHIAAGEPCQDFALSGTYKDTKFAIVSDGCSGANANTDIGSRTLVYAAHRQMPRFLSDPENANNFMLFDLENRNISDNSNDLAATLMVLWATTKNTNVKIWGDGVVLAVQKDGSKILWECSWDKETPFYLQYFLIKNGVEAFKKAHQSNPTPFSVRREERDVAGNVISEMKTSFTSEEMMGGWSLSLSSESIKSISIFSDGVSRVDGLTTWEATAEATAFKNTEGSFVKRRMIRAYQNWQKENRYLQDDLSVGTIVFPEES